jgi:hypothetical protein
MRSSNISDRERIPRVTSRILSLLGTTLDPHDEIQSREHCDSCEKIPFYKFILQEGREE